MADDGRRRRRGLHGAAVCSAIAMVVLVLLVVVLRSSSVMSRVQQAEDAAFTSMVALEHAVGIDPQGISEGAASTQRGKPRGQVAAASAVVSKLVPSPSSSSKLAQSGATTCSGERIEYNGELVTWGSTNMVASAEECCNSCSRQAAAHKPTDKVERCNTWVFCGRAEGCNHGRSKFGECWLKHNARADAAGVMSKGDNSDWTSGLTQFPEEAAAIVPFVHDKVYRTITTADDKVYNQWQMRVHYYQWKKVKAMPGSEDMGGFTRILHGGREDSLMDEIPTDVVDPLPPHMTKGFVVLSRPNAIHQWLKNFGHKYPEKYLMMSEPDHLWLRPIPNLMAGEHTPAAFPFFYITPQKEPDITNRFLDKPITAKEMKQIDPIGNSPAMIAKGDLEIVAPKWHNISVAIKHDPEADKAWGWVLEMYGYSFAAWNSGIRHKLYPSFMAQPPWDKHIGDFYILHYTYGCDYDEQGVFTPGKVGKWRFDKRRFSGRYPPKTYPPAPAKVPELTRKLVEIVMEAANALPDWPDQPLDHM